MNDRELLEMAAKAIGTVFVPGESWDDGAGWNPLTDDGDALRLLVELGMDVEIRTDCSVAWSCDGNFEEHHGTDKHAATRRAITRAAAELGRARA